MEWGLGIAFLFIAFFFYYAIFGAGYFKKATKQSLSKQSEAVERQKEAVAASLANQEKAIQHNEQIIALLTEISQKLGKK